MKVHTKHKEFFWVKRLYRLPAYTFWRKVFRVQNGQSYMASANEWLNVSRDNVLEQLSSPPFYKMVLSIKCHPCRNTKSKLWNNFFHYLNYKLSRDVAPWNPHVRFVSFSEIWAVNEITKCANWAIWVLDTYGSSRSFALAHARHLCKSSSCHITCSYTKAKALLFFYHDSLESNQTASQLFYQLI